MNRLQVKSWSGIVHGLQAAFRKLMASSEQACLFCGGTVRDASMNPLGLCSACMEVIPWIKRDKVLCEICGRYETCNDCRRRKETFFTRNRSAVRYDETMKEWLARFKYRGDEKLGRVLGGMMVHAYRLYPPGLKFDVITYVPLSKGRYEERGFNQAERLARELAAAARLPVVPVLVRVRHTAKQSFKTRSERLADLGGAFAVDPAAITALKKLQASKGRKLRILVMDDVYTTGSTMNQCAYTIRTGIDAEVFGLCWAR